MLITKYWPNYTLGIFLIFLTTQNSLAFENDNTSTSSSYDEEVILNVEEEIDRSFETDQKKSQHAK